MSYNREAHELLESAFKVLKHKKGYDIAYAYMVGLLMPNVAMPDAVRIAKMISEMEDKND
jgi:hypothetical protein